MNAVQEGTFRCQHLAGARVLVQKMLWVEPYRSVVLEHCRYQSAVQRKTHIHVLALIITAPSAERQLFRPETLANKIVF